MQTFLDNDARINVDVARLEEVARRNARILHLESYDRVRKEQRFSLTDVRSLRNVDLDRNAFVWGSAFVFGLQFGPHYPLRAPTVRLHAPLFHPNVSMTGREVCAGLKEIWTPETPLEFAVQQVLGIVQYRLVNPTLPDGRMNLAATEWYLQVVARDPGFFEREFPRLHLHLVGLEAVVPSVTAALGCWRQRSAGVARMAALVHG